MFEAQFTNGLPIKPIEYIGCVQDFEKHTKDPLLKNKKIFLIDKEYIDLTSGNLVGVYFLDEILYFDYEDKYLICAELENETKKFLSDGNTFLLAYYNNKIVTYEKEISISNK